MSITLNKSISPSYQQRNFGITDTLTGSIGQGLDLIQSDKGTDFSHLFFGPIHQRIPSTEKTESRTTFYPSDVYQGISFYMISTFDYLLNESKHFFLKSILPWFYTKNRRFQFLRYRVDPSLPDIYTPGANTRNVTASTETIEFVIRDYRIKMTLNGDFLNSSEGRGIYTAQLLNMRSSMYRNAILNGTQTLINTKTAYDDRTFSFYNQNVEGWGDYLNNEKDIMFIWHKDENPLHQLLHRLQPSFDVISLHPDIVILPKELKTFLAMGSKNKLLYSGSGPEFKKNLELGPKNYDTIMRDIEVAELSSIRVGSEPNDIVRPWVRTIQIGDYATLKPYIMKSSDGVKKFVSLSYAKEIINMNTANGKWSRITIEDLINKSNRFKSDGEFVEVMNQIAQNIGGYLNQIGVDNHGGLNDPFFFYDPLGRKYEVIGSCGDMEMVNYNRNNLKDFSKIVANRIEKKVGINKLNDFKKGIELIDQMYNAEITDNFMAFQMATVFQNSESNSSSYILKGNNKGGVHMPYFIKGSDLKNNLFLKDSFGRTLKKKIDFNNLLDSNKKYMCIKGKDGVFYPMIKINGASIIDPTDLNGVLGFGDNIDTEKEAEDKAGTDILKVAAKLKAKANRFNDANYFQDAPNNNTRNNIFKEYNKLELEVKLKLELEDLPDLANDSNLIRNIVLRYVLSSDYDGILYNENKRSSQKNVNWFVPFNQLSHFVGGLFLKNFNTNSAAKFAGHIEVANVIIGEFLLSEKRKGIHFVGALEKPIGYGSIPGILTIAEYAAQSYPENHGIKKKVLDTASNFSVAFNEICTEYYNMFENSPVFWVYADTKESMFCPWFFKTGSGNTIQDISNVFGMQIVDSLKYPLYLFNLENYKNLVSIPSVLTPDLGDKLNRISKEEKDTIMKFNIIINVTKTNDFGKALETLQLNTNEFWDKINGLKIFSTINVLDDFSNNFKQDIWGSYYNEHENSFADEFDSDSTGRILLNKFLEREIFKENNGGNNYLEKKPEGQKRLPGVNLIDHMIRFLINKNDTDIKKDIDIDFMGRDWINLWKKDPINIRFDPEINYIPFLADVSIKREDLKKKGGFNATFNIENWRTIGNSNYFVNSRLVISSKSIQDYARKKMTNIHILNVDDGDARTKAIQGIWKCVIETTFRPMNPIHTAHPLGLFEFGELNKTLTGNVDNNFTEKNIVNDLKQQGKKVFFDFLKSRNDKMQNDLHTTTIAQSPVHVYSGISRADVTPEIFNKNAHTGGNNIKVNKNSIDPHQRLFQIQGKNIIPAMFLNLVYDERDLASLGQQTAKKMRKNSIGTFGMNQIKRYEMVMKGFTNKLECMSALMWILSPARKNVFLNWAKNDLPVPFAGLLLRPTRTYNTLSMFIGEKNKIGYTAYGDLDYKWDFDPNSRDVHGYLKMAQGPVIIRKDKYHIVKDIAAVKYIGGEGIDPYLKYAHDKNFNFTTQDIKPKASMIYMIVPYNSMDDFDQPLDIRGTWSYSSITRKHMQNTPEGFMFPSWPFYNFIHDFLSINVDSYDEEYTDFNNHKQNTILFETGARTYDYNTKGFKETILNKGAFGPEGCYVGCKTGRTLNKLTPPKFRGYN